MAQLGFVFDPKRCRGCKACEVACKAENNTRPNRTNQAGRPEVNYREVCFQRANASGANSLSTTGYAGRRFLSVSCHHCTGYEDATGGSYPHCVQACPVAAISKDAGNGIVLIDRTVCIGCRRCNFACPYGAPRYNGKADNAARGGYGVTEKCTLCNHRLTAAGATTYNAQPACIQTCVGKALRLEAAVSFAADDIDGTAAVDSPPFGAPGDGTGNIPETGAAFAANNMSGARKLTTPAPSPMGRHTPRRGFPGRDLAKDADALPNTVWIN